MTTASGKLTGKVARHRLGPGHRPGRGRQVASEGAAVAVNELEEGPAAETVVSVEKSGGRATAVVGSVTALEFPDRCSAAPLKVGGIDIVVNNTGYVWDAVIQRMSDEQWDAILDVHLWAPFRLLRAVQPHLNAAAADVVAGRGGPPRGREHLLAVGDLWHPRGRAATPLPRRGCSASRKPSPRSGVATQSTPWRSA